MYICKYRVESESEEPYLVLCPKSEEALIVGVRDSVEIDHDRVAFRNDGRSGLPAIHSVGEVRILVISWEDLVRKKVRYHKFVRIQHV